MSNGVTIRTQKFQVQEIVVRAIFIFVVYLKNAHNFFIPALGTLLRYSCFVQDFAQTPSSFARCCLTPAFVRTVFLKSRSQYGRFISLVTIQTDFFSSLSMRLTPFPFADVGAKTDLESFVSKLTGCFFSGFTAKFTSERQPIPWRRFNFTCGPIMENGAAR